MPSDHHKQRLDAQGLDELVKLFYDQPERLARFQWSPEDGVPDGYRSLLAHEHHMTVTVEQFHQSPVDVEVLQKAVTARHYARMILLRRQLDQHVVQFGIMRVNLSYLTDEVSAEIVAERTPLGRILIKHDVLRRIHLVSLWKTTPGADLCRFFGLEGPEITYGRTALIECDHEPAIELLEIVTPLPSPPSAP